MRWARVLLLLPILSFAVRAHAQDAFDAAAWGALLERHATEDGGFRYAALRRDAADRASLDRVVASIGRAELEGLPREAQLAFYVDAYNALVVKSVVDRWPVESVMRVPGFFDRARHRVAGRELTLNQLENEVIRARFGEPRVHFALNCASAGCPPLSRRPYSGERDLAGRLEAQARAFVRRTTRIDRSARSVRASQIFEWYASDFPGGAASFLARYLDPADAAIVRAAELAYTPYDWAINARP